MTEHYHSPDDRRFARDLRKAAPAEFAAYTAFGAAAVGREDGAIPPKYRELIALGVALTTRCGYCLESHTTAAARLGATAEEIAELTYITAALNAGAAAAHGMLAMRLYREAVEAGQAQQ
jgi:AhpD family alkylhydroperoxidase